MLAWAFYTPVDVAEKGFRISDYLGLLVFLAGEVGNLYIHLILRNSRPKGTVEQRIPQDIGLGWVTCPSYIYETMAWIGVVIISRSWAVLLFILVGVAQMRAWARKKEKHYRAEFPNAYKHKRFVVLPGICYKGCESALGTRRGPIKSSC